MTFLYTIFLVCWMKKRTEWAPASEQASISESDSKGSTHLENKVVYVRETVANFAHKHNIYTRFFKRQQSLLLAISLKYYILRTKSNFACKFFRVKALS